MLVEKKNVEKGVEPLKKEKRRCGRKCGEKRLFSTAQKEKNLFTFAFQPFHRKMWKAFYWELMLEVMSRIVEAMRGSDLIRSSILRMEESTVA